MRKIIAALALMLTIGAAVPAFADTAVGANTGSSTFSAEAGAGGR